MPNIDKKKKSEILAKELKIMVKNAWEGKLKRQGGLENVRKQLRESAADYYRNIMPIFVIIVKDLQKDDSYYNRLSIVKILLRWVHQFYPKFVQKDYRESEFFPILVACNKDNLKDVRLGEYSEEYDLQIENYFSTKGQRQKSLGILFLLEYLHWAFAKNGYDYLKIKSSCLYFISLLNERL